MKKTLFFIAAITALLVSGISSATPVLFTTNDGPYPASNGQYRVQYITVSVDGVKKCYTESAGNCTATPDLSPGLHEVTYVWANCNNPGSCPHYGEVTDYVLVPDQLEIYYVRIPTVRVRWYTEYGVGISLNGVNRVWALGGGKGTTNVMSGCYTASYYKPYPGPVPNWPDPLPDVPNEQLYGFDRICFGSSDKYPNPIPDSGTDTNAPHLRITIPDYWP